MCKGKTLPGVVNELLKTKSLLTSPSNVFPYYVKKIFLPIIWIFTEGEGDGIESRLSFKIFSTLKSRNRMLSFRLSGATTYDVLMKISTLSKYFSRPQDSLVIWIVLLHCDWLKGWQKEKISIIMWRFDRMSEKNQMVSAKVGDANWKKSRWDNVV